MLKTLKLILFFRGQSSNLNAKSIIKILNNLNFNENINLNKELLH